MSAAIQYILTNEKYIGDILWQKSYNISVLFCKKRNNGEKDKWYLKNTHTPIVSCEDFAKVQELIELRKRPNGGLIQSYPLTKKVFCGECGSTFRRKCFRDKVCWICRGHMDKAENCSIKQISEELFYTTFITMYNKLKCNYTAIFSPLLTQLQDLKIKKFNGNKQYMDISKKKY